MRLGTNMSQPQFRHRQKPEEDKFGLVSNDRNSRLLSFEVVISVPKPVGFDTRTAPPALGFAKVRTRFTMSAYGMGNPARL